MAKELYTGVYGCTHLYSEMSLRQKVSLTLDFIHMTHVKWHRTHSYISHASHNDHSVGSADFPDILDF